jgi:hypothetical protein
MNGTAETHKFTLWRKNAMKKKVNKQLETDRLTIEMPLAGFTEEALANLNKMVEAKAPLLKKALGAEELPIVKAEETISFPWFSNALPENLNAYAQFISQLCKTAKAKKRVTAKPQEAFENEKFTMRVWLIGLGMIGAEFSTARRLLCDPLSGNSSWRYGKPETASGEVPANV